MIIVAWILLISFGFLSLLFLGGTVGNNKVHPLQLVFLTIFIVISALSAGVIWGGLFQ